MTDHELLKRYAQGGAEGDEAFRLLAERHAGLVYGTCVRGLGDRHLAEDAAQAVFILLAQKAARMNDRTQLPAWLFRTARYVVRNARRSRARHTTGTQAERLDPPDPAGNPAEERAWAEIRPVLDEAIEELPAQSREALVLHYLAGLSQSDVAARLGCSPDAAKKRIHYGLEKLRHRLASRGAVLSVLLLAGMLSTRAAEAAPAGLSTTCCAATAKGASGTAFQLAKGASHMMFTHQLLKAALASACLAVVLGGGVWAVRAAEQPEAKDTSTPKPDAPRPKPDAPKPKPGDPLAPQAGLDEAAVHKLLLQTVTTDQTVPNHRWSSFPAAEHRFARRKDAEFEALFPGFELWNVHNQSPIGGINPLWTLALDRANRRGFLLGSNTASPFEKNLDAFLKAAAYKPKDEAGATRCAAWIVRMSAQNTCFLAGDDFAKVAPEGKDLVAKLAQPDAKKDAGNGAYTVRVDSCEEFRWIHTVRVTLRRWTVTFPAAGGASLQAEVLETVPKK